MQEGGKTGEGEGGIAYRKNVKDEDSMEEDRHQYTMMYSKHFLLL
jgi:hypothetical protein